MKLLSRISWMFGWAFCEGFYQLVKGTDLQVEGGFEVSPGELGVSFSPICLGNMYSTVLVLRVSCSTTQLGKVQSS